MTNEPTREPECRIERSSLISDTGIVAEASWYPHAQICSGCRLRGKDLDINYGSGGRGVKVIGGKFNERAAAHCKLERFQRYNDPY